MIAQGFRMVYNVFTTPRMAGLFACYMFSSLNLRLTCEQTFEGDATRRSVPIVVYPSVDRGLRIAPCPMSALTTLFSHVRIFADTCSALLGDYLHVVRTSN
jgi:hypothetical protein